MPPPRIANISSRPLRKPLVPLSRVASRRSLATPPSSSRTRARVWFLAGTVLGGCLLIYAHDSRAGIHRWIVIPTLHALTADDPEKSHTAAVKVLASSFAPVDKGRDDEEVLGFDLWGRHFSNPIGLAAGFDKHGEAIDGLLGLGFGYVEIGSVTPEAQSGNPKPRFFRLPETQSVINRYGFNSDGHLVVLSRLRERIIAFARAHTLLLPDALYQSPVQNEVMPLDPVDRLLSSPAGRDAAISDAIGIPRSLQPGRVLAINLGKNKASNPDSLEDYLDGVRRLGPYADVLVVNVSSPNTPGLRQLQKRGMLEELLASVVEARDQLAGKVKPAVLVKISPDLSAQEIEDVAEAALETRIDGVIVSNTTISRPASAGSSPVLAEVGGLSGPAVKPLAIRTLASLYNATEGKMPLVGCGGVTTAQDAIDFARAGASFVQLYTSFGYQGPGLPRELKDNLSHLLRAQSKKWSDLVGVDAQRLVPPRPAKEDREIQKLRQELEGVLANLAEGRDAQHVPEGMEKEAVRAAAGLSDAGTAMPTYSLPKGDDVVAASTALQSTIPSAVQNGGPPQSGLLDASAPRHPLHPGAIPIVILEQAGIPPATEEAKKPLPRPEPVLPDLLHAAGQQAGRLAQKTADAVASATVKTSDALKEVSGQAKDATRGGHKTDVPLLKFVTSFQQRETADHGSKRLV